MVKDWFSVKKRIELCLAGWVSGWSDRSFQSGRSSFKAVGSITAPDRIWEPGRVRSVDFACNNLSPASPPFSSRTTRISLPVSCSSCFSLMAALIPAGPPPTIHTSTSSVARSTFLGSNGSLSRLGLLCNLRAEAKSGAVRHLRTTVSIRLSALLYLSWPTCQGGDVQGNMQAQEGAVSAL